MKLPSPRAGKGSLASLPLTVASAVVAVRRLHDARRRGDRLEILDAAANAAVVVTGVLMLVRTLRGRGPGR